MAEFTGGGLPVTYVCDECGKRLEVKETVHGAPRGWCFIAAGTSAFLESADVVWHFCQHDHLIAWLEKTKTTDLDKAEAIKRKGSWN